VIPFLVIDGVLCLIWIVLWIFDQPRGGAQ